MNSFPGAIRGAAAMTAAAARSTSGRIDPSEVLVRSCARGVVDGQ